jgi:hypothetical protein
MIFVTVMDDIPRGKNLTKQHTLYMLIDTSCLRGAGRVNRKIECESVC